MDCGGRRCQVPYPQRTWNAFGTAESPSLFGPTCDTNRTTWGGPYACYLTCRHTSWGCKDDCTSSTCANDTKFFETLLVKILPLPSVFHCLRG